MTNRRATQPGGAKQRRDARAGVATSSERADDAIRLRRGTVADLAAANAVVATAIATWAVSERVIRLISPSYSYTQHDLACATLVVADTRADGIVGVAVWERADPSDTPSGTTGLLLHGIYVHPVYQRQRLGSRLLDKAVGAARAEGVDGLLVKAQRDAQGFFTSRGLRPLSEQSHFPLRLWFPIGGERGE